MRLFNRWMAVLFVSLFGTRQANAQTTLTGTVRNAAGQPLEGILLEAETKAQPAATAFVISAADGSFKLTLAATPASDSVYRHARALGYAELLRRLPNRSQTVPLALRESTTQLKEVTVKGAPITRQGDTLSYKVDAFANKQDRVIADVLKKMPGIEVGGDGQISYEGKPINKFYINGQDLLESRYTMASNNLPADAVQSVQVLERHQPIRALDIQNQFSPAYNSLIYLTFTKKKIGFGAESSKTNHHISQIMKRIFALIAVLAGLNTAAFAENVTPIKNTSENTRRTEAKKSKTMAAVDEGWEWKCDFVELSCETRVVCGSEFHRLVRVMELEIACHE
ncbi:Plug and carboxypeptidase regulatory-like domain-containing protein [Hymenobacter sp. DH14]|uniref:Plug and carboxypeptidase regulatory-like domain-containing protein n=1 Tax=Hymenobacter cyanobacteriorum TaxID=2926463 RepID=A0A9X2AIR8_9BACT|nr:Plug and carboxypeptidase regulatory-like domain-containing protein [Hymenobacter cyanobacteriorum]MCI1188950.1 Plug and carboxypeptidase regulatory-like domain-containing protein [Hymenobacter cyanobacteriorum]